MPTRSGDVADAQLSRPQRIEDANASRIPEHPERSGDGVDVIGL